VKRRFRVRDNEQFLEVRRRGRSYSNRLAVLCLLGNGLPYSRFGFSVSRRIGPAVVRNGVERRMREAVRLRMSLIEPGWDCVFIARNPIRDASYGKIDEACAQLLRRASLANVNRSQEEE
jgi:ribonuclease P protein component